MAYSILGTKVKAINGQIMTCVECLPGKRCLVKFEDGTVVNADRSAFRRGQVKNPSLADTRLVRNVSAKVGLTNCSVSGQLMTIVEWNGTKSIKVKFEDGTEVLTSYSSFNKGCVNNPNFTYRDRDKLNAVSSWVGVQKVMRSGHCVTIVEYNGNDNILVRFDDGSERRCRLSSFNSGNVKHPDSRTATFHRNKRDREGYTFHTQQGLSAVIKEYNGTEDVVVQLETGLVKSARWSQVLSGKVFDPDYSPKIGQELETCYGIKAKIIEYTGYSKVKLQFEDGAEVVTSLGTAYKGRAIHPDLLIRKRRKFDYHNMVCEYIYSTDTDKYYMCSCPECGFDDILSAKEMLEIHTCKR